MKLGYSIVPNAKTRRGGDVIAAGLFSRGGKRSEGYRQRSFDAKANNQYLHEMQNIVGDHHPSRQLL